MAREVETSARARSNSGGTPLGPGQDPATDAGEGLGVPKILKLCVRAIWELNGHEAEGIFRLASDADTMFALREDVSKGDYTVLKNRSKTEGLLRSPIEAADLLKQWLRNMPDPLLPYTIYKQGVDIGRTLGPEAARSAVAVLMSAVTGSSGTMAEPSADASLDRLSFKTLRYLLHFCWELSAHEAVTKMGVSNLALVIAPNVMKVSRLSRLMVRLLAFSLFRMTLMPHAFALLLSPFQDESGDPLVFARNADAERGFVALLIDGIGNKLW